MKSNSVRKEQSFYIAVILYESSSNVSGYKPLYQECFFLIKACSLEEANEKALLYANQEQVSYENVNNEIITWSLKHIISVDLVVDDEFSDGAEIYARYFRNYDAYRLFDPTLSGEEL